MWMDQEMRYSTLTAYQTPDHFRDVSSGLRSPTKHPQKWLIASLILKGILYSYAQFLTSFCGLGGHRDGCSHTLEGAQSKVLFLNRSGAIPKSMLDLEFSFPVDAKNRPWQ